MGSLQPRLGGIVGYYSAAQGCVEWVEEGSRTGGVGMVVHAAKLSSRWSGRWSGRQGESTSDKTLSPGESAEGRGMEAGGPAYLSLACGIWGWWEEEDLMRSAASLRHSSGRMDLCMLPGVQA